MNGDMAMDLHHIRYFLAVSEALNFTKAASNCNVSQPALSRAIQQLEKEVGGLLFRRERNFTHLTDLGNLMKPHFEQIIIEINDVKENSKRFLTLEKANLNIGVLCTISPTRFTGLMTHFGRNCPGISIKMLEETHDGLAMLLEAGEIDVALMASAVKLPEKYKSEVLYDERFVIAFPTGHRFSNLRTIPMTALDGESYLQRMNCEFDARLDAFLNDLGVEMHTIYASEREDWIQNMVAAGLGLCFMPEFSAVLPGIQILPVSDPEVSREVCLVTMAGRKNSPAVASFLKSLRTISFPKTRFLSGPIATDNTDEKTKRKEKCSRNHPPCDP
jgi:LysR family transcriptional regulator, hydrogen peroxide-inducible genes activator